MYFNHLKRGAIGIIAGCGLFAISNAAQADVTIGFSGVLSGPQAALGQDQYDGLMLAFEQMDNKIGEHAIRVIREDDQLKPDVGAQTVRKFIEKDKVHAIVGLGFSNVLMAEYRIIRDSGVLALSTNAAPAPIAGRMCLPNFFALGWQNDTAAEATGQYFKNQGYKKVYLMSLNYQAGKDRMVGFKRFYGETPLLDEVYTPLEQLDYSADISRMQSRQPDAMFVFYPGGAGINFIRQLSQAGIMGKFAFFSDSLIDANSLAALKEQAVGAMFVTPWSTKLDNPRSRQFVKAFQEKYQRLPTEYAASAYDAGWLLHEAISKHLSGGKVDDSKQLAAAVKAAGATFESVRGKFRFNTNHMPVLDLHAYEVVKNNNEVELKSLGTVLTDHQDAYVSQCSMN